MKEPILSNGEGDIEIYRFTWLRTFHKPITIRIQKEGESVILIAKMLNGLGGYDPGHIIKEKKLKLTVKTWDLIQARVKQINFWSLPVENDFHGFDGAEWIFEGGTKDNYHFTTRWSPGENKGYGACCLYLLKLSGLKIPQLEIY